MTFSLKTNGVDKHERVANGKYIDMELFVLRFGECQSMGLQNNPKTSVQYNYNNLPKYKKIKQLIICNKKNWSLV